MFVGDEVMHEMLPDPFFRGESYIFAAQFIEDDRPAVPLCHFYGILWKV